MKHFYHTIEGSFSFQKIYAEQVLLANNNSHFVEVGTYLGRSASFMIVEIINSGKSIKFDCVDTWSLWPQSVKELKIKNTFYKKFIKNIEPVKEYVNPIQLKSIEAAKLYEDESLDFVFIDAHHTYEEVFSDIHAWYPKVKIGGTIAGHDYYIDSNRYEGLKKAVHDSFSNKEVKIDTQSFTWSVNKNTKDLD